MSNFDKTIYKSINQDGTTGLFVMTSKTAYGASMVPAGRAQVDPTVRVCSNFVVGHDAL
jgi:hypothetical protein